MQKVGCTARNIIQYMFINVNSSQFFFSIHISKENISPQAFTIVESPDESSAAGHAYNATLPLKPCTNIMLKSLRNKAQTVNIDSFLVPLYLWCSFMKPLHTTVTEGISNTDHTGQMPG